MSTLGGAYQVGGTVFQCNEENALGETERIIRFFKKVCSEQNARYPADLHYDFKHGCSNAVSVNRVKGALIAEMSDFMLGRGRWVHDAPQGVYDFYAIVGDKAGMESVQRRVSGSLSSDAVASNRYEHMAYRVIQNLLLYNRRCKEKKVRLDLATRAYSASDDQTYHEAETIGARKAGGRADMFNATDTNSYRAMLLEAIQDSSRADLQVELHVESIQYDVKHEHQAFLYLADTICSLYQNMVGNVKSSGDALQRLMQKSNEILGKGHAQFWAYHGTDVLYRKIYRAYDREDDFDALQAMYQIREKQDVYAACYDAMWLKEIENAIILEHRPSYLSAKRLGDYLYSPQYRLDTAAGIFAVLKQQAASLTRDERNARLLCELGKVDMTISNHSGNYEASELAYHSAIEMAQYLPIEDYFELRNMLTVSFLDARKNQQALETSLSTLEYVQLVSSIKSEIYSDAKDSHLLLGRTLSQVGQCYAFNKQNDKACEYFRQAIETFGDNQMEIGKTRSYYLHALIEGNNRQGYAEQAAVYFESDDIGQQFRNILSLDNISAKFALYVFMKAMYVLYRKDLDSKFVTEVTDAIYALSKKACDGHPWEMILKYCAFLRLEVISKQRTKLTDEMMHLAAEAVAGETTGILPLIIQDGEAQYQAVVKKEPDVFARSTMTYMYR